MRSVIVTPPTALPVTLDEVKAAGRIEIADDEALLDRWMRTAVELAQAKTRRQLITATWKTYHDGFCSESIWTSRLNLGWGPLQSVSSVSYIDETGTTQTLSSSIYVADTASLLPAIELLSTKVWPGTQLGRSNSVWITYVAGYGASAMAVPEPIRHWIIRTTLALNAVREPITERAIDKLPHDYVDGLLDPYRVVTM